MKCRTCRYYDESASAIEGKGSCRYNSPVLVSGHPSCEGYWPYVWGAEDWCGKHED